MRCKYYFNRMEKDPECCYTLSYWKKYMVEQGLKAMELVPAVPYYGSGAFYCKAFGEVGEVSDSGCGSSCCLYKPRNGKNGRCKSSSPVYTTKENSIKIISIT